MITLDELIKQLEEVVELLDMDEEEVLDYDERTFGEAHAMETKKLFEKTSGMHYATKCGIATSRVFGILSRVRFLREWQRLHKSQ